MITADALKRMHWEEGLPLEKIGEKIYYSPQQVSKLLGSYGIPTTGSLVRCFNQYRKSPELDYYLKWYMENYNRYSMANNGRLRWRTKSVSKPNISRLGSYLKRETDITYSIYSIYRQREGHVLETTGFKNCLALSWRFDLSWHDELLAVMKRFPNSPKLRQGEALDLLLSVMASGEWIDLPSLSGVLNWSSDRTSRVLYTAMNKHFIERAGEKRGYMYRII
ncbi:hypothetical protein A3K63_05510 [Candidatus Micrarchaeota archaeon RBG_16_49_10]|nr:MAG: hypothetical protein A3K63_05510 [Candidatus Micrarchaeota archaeon RBG_16_49_10]